MSGEPEISGYRQLNPDEVAIVNHIKALDEDLGRSFQTLRITIAGNVPNADWRWLAIAKTHFQEGFMALVRSVTKPEDWYGN
jgi:hypothetical protein